MKFDLMKAIGFANKISSPKEAIGMALNMLAKKNPAMAKNISDMIKSGKDPSIAIQEFAQEGKVNSADLDKMKNVYAMAKKAGFKKFDVPKSVWDKAENALKTKNTAPKNTDWF